jgi:ferredoxin--NADP+ reductase
LIEEQNVDRVIAVARRGPGEVKFDRKELEGLVGYLDRDDLEQELERVDPIMREVLQDPNDFRALIAEAQKKAGPVIRDTCFSLRFLSSPVRIMENEWGGVAGLQVEKNRLALGDDGECRAKGTGQLEVIDVDTVIFAIGDIVDGALGLPLERGEFVKNPNPRFPMEGVSYEAFNPQTGAEIPDLFLTGWARRPSVGLVGVARKDAVNAVQAVTQYLQTVPPTTEPVLERLREALVRTGHPIVEKRDLLRLDALEQEKARELGLPYYKFNTNQEMLAVLGLVSSRET